MIVSALALPWALGLRRAETAYASWRLPAFHRSLRAHGRSPRDAKSAQTLPLCTLHHPTLAEPAGLRKGMGLAQKSFQVFPIYYSSVSNPHQSTMSCHVIKFTLAGPAGPRKGMGLAQKLLEKMGWKEGEGLGKNRQVRRVPVVVHCIARSVGIYWRVWAGTSGAALQNAQIRGLVSLRRRALLASLACHNRCRSAQLLFRRKHVSPKRGSDILRGKSQSTGDMPTAAGQPGLLCRSRAYRCPLLTLPVS